MYFETRRGPVSHQLSSLPFLFLFFAPQRVTPSSPFFSSSAVSSLRVPFRLLSMKENAQDALVQSLLLAKDAEILAKDEELQRTLKVMQAKDDELQQTLKVIQAKDDELHRMIQAKDDELHRMLKCKDDIIRTKDDIIRTKDNIIRMNDEGLHRRVESKEAVIRAEDEMYRAHDELLQLVRSQLADTTAKLWQNEGRLNLRNTIENFENRALGWESELVTSYRAKKWSSMLKANASGIAHLILEERRPMTAAEVDRWLRAAQDLYKSLSSNVHYSLGSRIEINASLLDPDPLHLAICTAKATPIPFLVTRQP